MKTYFWTSKKGLTISAVVVVLVILVFVLGGGDTASVENATTTDNTTVASDDEERCHASITDPRPDGTLREHCHGPDVPDHVH